VFDSLSERLQQTLSDVRQRGTLTEQDIDAALREIRLALLEADVNFKVVKQFTADVKERCLGAEIVGRLNAGQQVVKIVAAQLTELMGGESADLRFASSPPTVILIAGLQGSGKTTAAAKLARHLHEEHNSSVALAACDTYRPAAVEQLVKLGARAGATVYERGTEPDPVEIAAWALQRAREDGKDVLIVDTSGRLHVDAELMAELVRIHTAVSPQNTLLVVDAMTGQDAVNVASQFASAVSLDGVLMSKLDGDARGGAALSVKAVTGCPILFASTGEHLDQFERFHPDRMAQRILGMGDVLSLIEHAEREFDENEALDLQRKLRRNEFGLDDFLSQLQTVRKMGPLSNLLGMIPGFNGAQLRGMKVDERELDRLQAIILAMTPAERRRPELIKGSRRLRIARGSGTTVQQVSALVKQFGQMRKVMRQVGSGKMPDVGALLRQAR
jgi:signal recognition particle subunit SRP54